MRNGKRAGCTGNAAILAATLLLIAFGAGAGTVPSIRLAELENGNGGAHINLTVAKLGVEPVRAHVGDVIRIEVWVDNREDGSQSTNLDIFANRKRVARQMFRWGSPADPRMYKMHLDWDTSGMAPGEYRIKAEAFVFEDTSPFDNELTLGQSVILAAPGGAFPGGAPAGGSAAEIDERYKSYAR
ncbi:MAG: hypothetical protein AB1346_05535 [Thermodesulfobacteriota bacterium]